MKYASYLYGDYTHYTDYTHVWCTRTQCCIRRLENPRKIFTAVKTVDVCCRVGSGLRSTKVKDKFSNPRWVLLSSFLAYVHTGKTGLEQWKVKIWSSLSAPRNPRTYFIVKLDLFLMMSVFISLCRCVINRALICQNLKLMTMRKTMTRTTMLIYNPNLFNIYRGKFADDGSEGVGGGGGGGVWWWMVSWNAATAHYDG